jgi:hypothetical protein
MEAFIVEPRMSSNSINEEALKDWESVVSLLFEAWFDKFPMASAANKGVMYWMQVWKSKKTSPETRS